MHTLGQLFLFIVLVGGFGNLLLRAAADFRAAGNGRTARASRGGRPALRMPGTGRVATARTAGKSIAAAAVHPGNRQIRAQARADGRRLWTEAITADWLERQRHARQNGAAKGDGGSVDPGHRWVPDHWVPDHDGDPQGILRKAAQAVIPRVLYRKMPGPWQGALCGCAICRGEQQHPDFSPDGGNGHPPSSPAGAGLAPPTAAQKTSIPSTNGGTTVAAGTSTASAEKLIEGINEIYAKAAAGNIHAKREAVKAAHEGCVRFSGMLQMLSRTMSENDNHFGPEITEPLAQGGQNLTATAMSLSETDAALTTLMNMTLAEVASSPRQAPHHSQLSEAGAS